MTVCPYKTNRLDNYRTDFNAVSRGKGLQLLKSIPVLNIVPRTNFSYNNAIIFVVLGSYLGTRRRQKTCY